MTQGQIPKFALNNFLKTLLKLRKFITPMWVGEISPNFESKQANAILKKYGVDEFLFSIFSNNISHQEMSKKGTGQHTV